jgi:hypothetical protein
MYTPWEKKYDLLADFGDLLRKPAAESGSKPASAPTPNAP